MRTLLALTFAAVIAPLPAFALQCSPKDNSARVLSSPSPNDIHPDWSGEAYLGMSWSFVVHGSAEDGTGKYLRGNLISPRGGIINADVYVLRREWICE